MGCNETGGRCSVLLASSRRNVPSGLDWRRSHPPDATREKVLNPGARSEWLMGGEASESL